MLIVDQSHPYRYCTGTGVFSIERRIYNTGNRHGLHADLHRRK